MNTKTITISNSNELVRMLPARVVYVKSDGNYSTFVLHDGTEELFVMNLAHCQQAIEKQLGKDAEVFIRIGKQVIINQNYIYRINVSKQELWLSTMDKNMAFKISASKEALKQLKIWLDSQVKEI